MNYLIYDTALNGLYTLTQLQQQYPANRSLFKGTKDESLVDVAPYVFLVNEVSEKILNDADVSLKCVLVIETPLNLEMVAGHFREFIYQKVRGRECYFRFWDARVLKKFLPTCNDIQLNYFFRNINSISLPDDDPAFVLQYRVQRSRLNTERNRTPVGWPLAPVAVPIASPTLIV